MLRSALPSPKRQRGVFAGPGAHGKCCRPFLEQLEDRLTPADVFWAVDSDGFWDVAANWSTGAVPGPEDDAVIDRAAGDFTVTIRSGDLSARSIHSREAVVLSGGLLTVAAASQFDGPLTLSGGTLGGAGDVTLSGHLSWTAGQMIGSGLTTAQGTVLLSGDEVRDLAGRTFVNTATATMTGTGILRLSDGAVITNQTGAAFDLQGDGDLSGGTGTAFYNAGSFIKSAGRTDGWDSSGVYPGSFHNGGTVDVRAGRLAILAGGNHTGHFMAARGATVELSGLNEGVTHELGPSSSVSGEGTVSFGRAGFFERIVTVNVAGRYDVTGNTAVNNARATFTAAATVHAVGTVSVGMFGTLDFSSGEAITAPGLHLGGHAAILTGSDTITVTGSLGWSTGVMSGTGQTIVQGNIGLVGVEHKHLDGRTFINRGNATVLGSGPLHFRNGAVFDNRPGATFEVRSTAPNASLLDSTGTGLFNNAGTFLQTSGTSVVGVRFRNAGSVVAASNIDFDAGLAMDDSGWLATDAPVEVGIGGNLTGTTRNADLHAPRGTLRMDGAGTQANPQLLEVVSRDLGSNAAGFQRNFAYGTLALANNTYVRLVDNADNAVGGAEALYVDHLIVPAGSTLDLNLIPVYARAVQVAGQIVGGSVHAVADGGPLLLNTPTPGAIAAAGEVDEWTFFGRPGQGVTVVVNPGGGPPPAPLAPALNRALVRLLNPQGQVLATASSGGHGELASLPAITLPAEGVYKVQVDVPPEQAGSQGNYVLTVWGATIDVAPVALNQQTAGLLETPYSVDRWTFSGFANQQIRFDFVNAASNAIRFKLTGPNGWTGFDGLGGDSGLLTLPASGTYALEAFSSGGSGGAYSFRLAETSLTSLTPGVTYQGTLAGSGHAQLFRVELAQVNPLLVSLDAGSDNDRTEVYVRLGAPPTRREYDYRSDRPGADHFVAAPLATPGTWYVLVYGEAIPNPSPFSLRADSTALILERVTPDRFGANSTATLTLAGAGFLPGSRVELVAAGGAAYAARSVQVDGFDRLTAEFDLTGVPAGGYDVRVSLPGGLTNTLPGAFQVVSGGQPRLETRIIVPPNLGLGGGATLYVEYANTGTAAMPAPILTLQATHSPLFTLDASRLAEGVWGAAVPDGFSNSVQIYASGATPGLLLPGESFRVPVYYARMLRPFDFGVPRIDFEILVHEAGNPSPIDWASLRSSLKPSWMAPDAWEAVFANLTAQVGPTWGDYVRMLSDNASYLSRLGLHVIDVSQLYSFELQQAAGLGLFSTLTSAVDAFLPAAGLSLAFGRSFGNTITERYGVGPFGRGWTSTWDTSLERLADGTVVVHESADAQRRFQPDVRLTGVYFSQAGDTGKLRGVSGGAYELTEADGLVTCFRADGKLEYVQDTNGNRITAAYAGGRLTGLTHSSGASLALAYNAAGRVASVTDSAGRTTTYTYDPASEHLVSVTGPEGTTTYTYSAGAGAAREHALLSVTEPGGVTSSFEYDDRGRLTATYRADTLERTEYDHDSAGRVTVTDATGAVVKLFFDHRGLVMRGEDGLGAYTRLEYDDDFRPVRETDSLGRFRSYAWSGSGALKAVTDEYGRATTFAPAGLNNLPSAFTDARDNTVRYTYDTAGNLTATTYPDGSVERISYDALGNPTSLVNRRGQVIGMTYNAAGQLTQETYPDGSTAAYTYDAHGLLSAVTTAQGTTTFSYDDADRLTRVEYPNGRWLEYAHDEGGRRTRMADHTGFVVQYRYDSGGRLSELRDASDALIVAYAYDVAGQLSQEDKGNGTSTVYGYDEVGRVESIVHRAPGGAVNARFDYTYDTLGRRVGMATLDGEWDYTYDLTGQLTRAVFTSTNPEIPNEDLNYEYDAVGNRVRTVLNGATTNYTANGLNQYTAAGTTTYRYDLDGNLVEEVGPSGSRYAYDALSRLVEVVTPEGTWQYEYDALGNRTAVIANGLRTEYLLDPTGLGDVVAEYDASGHRAVSYAHGLGLEGTSSSGDWRYYDFDALGSTAGVSGLTGEYVNRYAYEPFGGSLLNAESVANPFEYVGAFGVMAEGNGLHFMRARYYGPASGRFVNEDPSRLNGGLNLYSYVNNNPITFIDPLGLQGVPESPPPEPPWEDAIHFGLHEAERYAQFFDRAVEPFEAEKHYLHSLETKHEKEGHHESQRPEQRPTLPPPGNKGRFVKGYMNGPPPQPPASSGVLGGIASASALIGLAFDPNEKFASAGFGPQGFIPPDTAIPYRVNFENLGPGSVPATDHPATVPAQRVEITDQLSSDLDWATFRFTEAGFGDTLFQVPDGRQYHFVVVPMTFNGQTFDVEVELSFDSAAGSIRAVFQAVDPDTSLPPDVLAGLLPPEDGTGRGKGHIAYTVQPRAGLPNGTEIRNVALIRFDRLEVIATNQVDPHDPTLGTDPAKEALVTIDAAAPNSSVEALPAVTATAGFTVRWAGQDDPAGSGIRSYDVYVSDNGGPFALWQGQATGTSAVFTGQHGHTYAFYSVATDNVGHTQPIPGAAQAITAVAGAVLTLRQSGGDVVLVDDGTGNILFRQALGDPAAIVVPGGPDDTRLTIDFAAGFFTLPAGSAFHAGGGQDSLAAAHDSHMTVTAGTLTINAFSLAFTDLEQVHLTGGDAANVLDASGFPGSATLVGGGGNDTLKGGPGNDFLTGGPGNDVVIGNGGIDTLGEAGNTNMKLTNTRFTGGVQLGTDVLSGVEQARLTGGDGNNVISAGSFTLGDVVLDGGPGNDRLTGGRKNDTLIGGPGSDTLIGGPGSDLVSATGSGTFVLRATRLYVAGVRDVLTGIDRADLTGDSGRDVFNISGWLRPARLDGQGGTDLLYLTRGGSTTLSDTQVSLSASVAYTLAGIEEATLVGGRGADRFTVSGWSGAATLNGAGGTDTVIASDDVDFTLTNALLTRSTGGTFVLTSIERAILSGGAGNNTLDASAFTLGSVILVGQDGDDTLRGGARRDLLLGGRGTDTLSGYGGDDVLLAGWTNHDSSPAILDLLMREWSRTDLAYHLRRNHLLGTLPGGKNARHWLNAAGVHDDGVSDELTGDLGRDWFLALAGEVTDRNLVAETLTEIS